MNCFILLFCSIIFLLPFVKKQNLDRFLFAIILIGYEIQILSIRFYFINTFILLFTELIALWLLDYKIFEDNLLVYLCGSIAYKIIIIFIVLFSSSLLIHDQLLKVYIEGNILFLLIRVILMLIMYFMKERISFYLSGKLSVLIILAVFYLYLESSLLFYLSNDSNVGLCVLVFASCVSSAVLIVILYNRQKILKSLKDFKQKQHLEIRNNDIRRILRYKEERIKLKHDYIHQLSELDKSVDVSSPQEVHEAIHNILNSIQPEELISYSDNEYINEMIEQKKCEYPGKNFSIYFDCIAKNDELFNDLSFILSKLIDLSHNSIYIKISQANNMIIVIYSASTIGKYSSELILFINDFITKYHGYWNADTTEINMLLNI